MAFTHQSISSKLSKCPSTLRHTKSIDYFEKYILNQIYPGIILISLLINPVILDEESSGDQSDLTEGSADDQFIVEGSGDRLFDVSEEKDYV